MKKILSGFATAALVAMQSFANAAYSQDYPSKPIELIIPFGAGGPSDIIGRLTAEHLSRILGQPVVPINKPGAGGTVGAEAAVGSDADGYTLLLGTSSNLVINPLLRPNLPYDAQSDLVPISTIAIGQFVLATNENLPVNSVAELLAYNKENPGSLNMGSGGVGGTAHLTGEMFKSAAGLNFNHIPYRGGGEATKALASGEVDFVFDAVPLIAPLAKDGKVRALALTGEVSSSLLPGVPTMSEAGVDNFTATFWNGLVAPSGTPPEVIDVLSAAVTEMIDTTDFGQTVERLGLSSKSTTPQGFAEFIAKETNKIRNVIEQANISVE